MTTTTLPGEADTSTPWQAIRRPLRPTDRVLVSETHLWLRQIPSGYHPKQLCRHYPRLANTLAQCWANAGLTDKFLTDLLIDKRGGRKGFPARIVEELEWMRRLRLQRSRRAPPLSVRIRRMTPSLTGVATHWA